MAEGNGEAARAPMKIALTVRESGLGWIEMRPSRGGSVPLTIATLASLDSLLEKVERLAAEGAVRLLLLSTSAPHPKLTGYDLEELRPLVKDEIVAWSQQAQSVLRRLEELPLPSIAAIQSDWLGGAAELALACSYRVAPDAPFSRIGFPQTRLGFLPAWGGTVRLPRLVGLQTALQLVLSGRVLSATEAHDIGLVDQLLPSSDFPLRLEEYAQRRLELGRPGRRPKRPVRLRLLDETAPGRRLLVARAARRHLGEVDSDSAGRMALALMAETVALPLDRAFAREARAASRLIIGRDVRARLHSQHFSDRAERRMPSGRGEFESAAVLGAGETGSDFAHRLASTGTAVRIQDVRREAVREGVARARERLDWERVQERITEHQARRRSARLAGGTGFGGFGTLDLVIAVADAAERDAEALLAEAEAHVGDDCLLGFHDWVTSTSEIQRSINHPERVIGLAPSFPLEQFALLEIVPGTLTSPKAVSLARRLAKRLALIPVVVSDQTPTPGTRLLAIYLAEASRLLDEGIPVDLIDQAAVEFGFDVGPFHRADAMGNARACRLLERVASKVGDRMAPGSQFQRIGREGATFFRYRGGRPSGPNPSLPHATSAAGPELTELIQRRLLLLLFNEAARVVEEGGVMDPGDLEVVALFGLGFPRQRGGLLFHAQTLGILSVVEDLAAEAMRAGDRFAPAGLLRDLAFTGRGFFDTEPEPPGQGLDAVLQ